MAQVRLDLGDVKGPQGNQGEQGVQGDTGTAATISIGSVSTTAYGNNARVTNSGTENAAVFDFVIPQGRPGEETTKIDNLTIDTITEPSTEFPVPAVDDNGSTLFGKITKWFSDMYALVATKFNASNVVNNLSTTSSGYALDARQGKTLKDRVDNPLYLTSQVSLNRTAFSSNSCIAWVSGSTLYITGYFVNTTAAVATNALILTLTSSSITFQPVGSIAGLCQCDDGSVDYISAALGGTDGNVLMLSTSGALTMGAYCRYSFICPVVRA